MKTTAPSQPESTPPLPKFRNRHNAGDKVCRAFTALGELAGVDVDEGEGPADLDPELVQAAYESNFGDPHFLGGPACFHYADTKEKVNALAVRAAAVTQGYSAYFSARGCQETIQKANAHIAVIEAAIAWLRKTNRSP